MLKLKEYFLLVTDVKNKKRNKMNIDNLNAICKICLSFQARNIDCRTFEIDSRHLELHNNSNLYNPSSKNK